MSVTAAFWPRLERPLPRLTTNPREVRFIGLPETPVILLTAYFASTSFLVSVIDPAFSL